MEEEKPWYESKIVWAQVVGVIAGGASLFGFDVLQDPALQASIVGAVVAAATIVARIWFTKTTIK